MLEDMSQVHTSAFKESGYGRTEHSRTAETVLTDVLRCKLKAISTILMTWSK